MAFFMRFLLVAWISGIHVAAFQPNSASSSVPNSLTLSKEVAFQKHSNSISFRDNGQTTGLLAAPKGALRDIVIPNVFNGGILASANEDQVDERIWVPQTESLDFRPLCFCVSQGYYVNLLRFRGGGVLGCHKHSSPVHALTLKGSWGYREHDWHAAPGTYVFEPPGETHTLVVDEDCDEMVALFHVTGNLIYVDPETGATTGYDDVFTKLEKARAWYKECGLGEDYVEQFLR